MHGMGTRTAGARVLRPLARAADGIVHNRERRRRIRRYRCVSCVTFLVERSADSTGEADRP
jgi:hypothetical protein